MVAGKCYIRRNAYNKHVQVCVFFFLTFPPSILEWMFYLNSVAKVFFYRIDGLLVLFAYYILKGIPTS